MFTPVQEYMVIFHNDHQKEWYVCDSFLATTHEAAIDFATARTPEGYHVEMVAESDKGPMLLDVGESE